MLTRSRRRAAPRRDEGFTLVELLLSVTILGLVMGAITAAMTVAFATTRETDKRLGSSADVQFSSTWFADDIAGATNSSDIIAGTPAVCSASGPVTVLTLRNRDLPVPSAAPTPVASPTPVPVALTVVYRLERATNVDGTFCELHRVTNGTYTRDDLIARRLSTTAPFAITTTSASVRLTLTASDATTFTLFGTRRSS